MKRILLSAALFLCFLSGFAQVVINEMDSDTPGTNDKQFIELKSALPNASLNGYVLVFFNGSTTSSTASKSYFTLDLDGVTTDANGLVVIGNSLVAPVPEEFLQDGAMQVGPDAIAIYAGNETDFPDQTLATSTNLVSALAYTTNGTDCAPLRTLLGLTVIYNENANGSTQTHSIQRKNDGTYEVKLPTPGVNNDGSGILYNNITVSVPAAEYNEGNIVPVTFTTSSPVASTPLTFSFTLNSGTFTTADFTGVTTVSIPVGSSSFTTNITLVDDSNNEGDELMKVNIGTIPSGYKRNNDNIEVRVIDNDFTVADWGTPLNPTYGIVSSTAPAGYYASLEGKSGAQLKQAIQAIIANPAVVHGQNYGDVTNILKQADQNPQNSNQVWLMYVEQGRAKYKFQSTASNTGSWNREHIFPQSRGGFSGGTDSTPDGINTWQVVGPDIIASGHGDAHHIRSEDGPENSSRNNKDYGLNAYNGPAGNQGSWHGDVARALFYMAVRYNALSLVNGNPEPDDSSVGYIGDLATLLVWNHQDPSDDFEMNRNNVIYTWQVNRNPFIDYPNLADYIWGSHAGETWFAALSTPGQELSNVGIFPNPAKDRITVSGIKGDGSIVIYNLSGMKIFESRFNGEAQLKLDLPTGMYLARVTSENKSAVKKLMVK